MITEFETRFPRLFPRNLEESFRKVPSGEQPEFFQFFSSDRKYIGVYLQELTAELADFFGVQDGVGLLVTKLTEDGPAEKAGIKVGDVIVKADGRTMKSQSRLTNLIQRKDKGDKIELEIIRDKKKKTLQVEVDLDPGSGVKFFSSREDADDYLDSWSSSYSKEQESAKQFFKSLGQYKAVNKNLWKNRLQDSQKNYFEIQKKQQENLDRNYRKAEEYFKQALKRYRCIKV